MRKLGSLFAIVLAVLLGPRTAFAQSECENGCDKCSWNPDMWMNLGFGVSTYMTWMEPTGYCTGEFSCVWWEECRGPETEDATPQETLDAELDELFALETDRIPDWVRANREDFRLAVVDGTLQVAKRCGAVITWVALDPGQVATTRALLDQE